MQALTLSCSFCGLQGHIVDTCHCFNAAKTQATQNAKQKQEECKNGWKCTGKANAAQESTPTSPGSSAQTEFAGKARPAIPSHSYLPHNTSNHLWTADTGVTSHMTPHKHWLCNYQPFTIFICLANNTVIFSADVGSVVFAPEVEEELVHHVEFSRVLHVPELGSNLLSVLYLARNHQFNIHISSKHMDFVQDGMTCFCASINASNTAQLAGTVIPSPESALAGSAFTLPLDESLWHCQFAHFHHAGLRKLVTESIVLGLKLDSSTPADPICEPCCHRCNLNAPIFALFSHIFILCFRATTVVASTVPLAHVYNTCTVFIWSD
jgi:hypothetical protein